MAGEAAAIDARNVAFAAQVDPGMATAAGDRIAYSRVLQRERPWSTLGMEGRPLRLGEQALYRAGFK